MANSCHSRNLPQAPNASLNLERAAESALEPQNSGGRAESVIHAIEALFGVTTLLTCVGYGGWLVFCSAAEVVSRATFHDFIRCFS